MMPPEKSVKFFQGSGWFFGFVGRFLSSKRRLVLLKTDGGDVNGNSSNIQKNQILVAADEINPSIKSIYQVIQSDLFVMIK